MALFGHKAVIAKCPACHAGTKVALVPGRTVIRCPRCQAIIPLVFARRYIGHAEGDSPPQTSDNAKEAPPSSQPAAAPTPPPPRTKKPARSLSVDIHYQDPSRKFTYISFAVACILLLAAAVTIAYNLWRHDRSTQHLAYVANLRDTIETLKQARQQLALARDPVTARAAETKLKELKAQLAFLAARRPHLTVPTEADFSELPALQEELAAEEKAFAQAEKEPPPNDAPKAPPRLGRSALAGPPPSPSQRQTQPDLNPPDASTVLVLLPGITAKQVNDDLLKRFAAIADNQAGEVTPSWSGDLLTLHVKPVADPADFATRISFGRLLYYSRADRSVTLQLDLSRLGAAAPSDPLAAMLNDLKQRDNTTRLSEAMARLAEIKPGAMQAEFSAALESIAVQADLDPNLRQQAIRLLPLWAGPSAANLLEKLLEDKRAQVRAAALDGLVELRAVKSAPAIVKFWGNGEADRISRALIALGSGVEPQVLPFLNHSNNLILRLEACKVLKEIGTSSSLKPLLDLKNEKDLPPVLLGAVKDAMVAILGRDEKK